MDLRKELQESAFKAFVHVRDRATDARQFFETPISFSTRVVPNPQEILGDAVSRAASGDFAGLAGLAHRGRTPTTQSQLRVGIDRIIFGAVDAAARRHEYERAVELPGFATTDETRLRMRTALDDRVMGGISAAARNASLAT